MADALDPEPLESHLQQAAQLAYDRHAGRGDFLQRAGEVWDRMFESEEAKARQEEQRKQFWADWFKRIDSPAYRAKLDAAEARVRAEEDAARAARAYPVLYPAKQPGRAIAVERDGSVVAGHMDADEPERFIPDSLSRVVSFVRTSAACPEQHDAYIGPQQVGYLRLRHGMFTVDYPDVRGEQVFVATPRGDGEFEASERPGFLDAARAALFEAWLDEWGEASLEAVAAEVARQTAARAQEQERHRAAWREHVGTEEP